MPSRPLSEAFTSHPEQHKFMDLNSFKELPETHAWTSKLDDYPFSGGCDAAGGDSEAVPIIDLDGGDAMELVGHACKNWGVFQVTNHGVPNNLLDDIELAGKRLFSLPMQQKLKAARVADGVSGYGVARISSFFSKLMWSEGFTIFGSPDEHVSKLWPQDHHRFWYVFSLTQCTFHCV